MKQKLLEITRTESLATAQRLAHELIEEIEKRKENCTHSNVKALGVQRCPDCGWTVDYS